MSQDPFIPGLKLFPSEPLSAHNLRDEPDWVLVERITGKKCPENVNLRSLSRMTDAERINVLGLTEIQAKRLGVALVMGERLANEPVLRTQPVGKASEIFRVLKGSVKDARKEGFYAFTLDQKHRLIDIHRISEGSLTMTLVHPREAFVPVIRDSAAAVIFVHNHPSGDPEPSPDDWRLTQRLVECGTLLGIRVVDHVVVGHEDFSVPFVSLRDRGGIGDSIAAESYGSGVVERDWDSSPGVADRRNAFEKNALGPFPERFQGPGPKPGGGKRSPEVRKARDRDDDRGR